MQKLRESGRITINTATIYNDLKSDDPLACMYALKYCALSKIDDINIIKAIVKLKSSTLVEWNSCKVSDCAIAALHIMGVETYTGSNSQIMEMISTQFYSI